MTIINCTLMVQAMNFFIAFFILKYFFIKYAVAHLQAEDILQESLVNIVQEHQLAVTQKEKELKLQWQAMHSYFVKHVPSLKPDIKFLEKQSAIIKPDLKAQELKPTIDRITQEIKKKVSHA